MRTSGFIALMSAIIISAVLLVVATTGSFTGFFGRSSVLDSELKERSSATADACADQAFVLLTNDPAYIGLNFYTLNQLDVCRVTITAGTPNIRIQATSSNAAVTNLLITYDPTSNSVSQWQEVPK